MTKRNRRVLPSGLEPPGTDPLGPVELAPDVDWLQPIPDALVADPADEAIQKDDLRLALIASVQFLPPRQRAVLLLWDVLAWSAAEVEEGLAMSVAVKNALCARYAGPARDIGCDPVSSRVTMHVSGTAAVVPARRCVSQLVTPCNSVDQPAVDHVEIADTLLFWPMRDAVGPSRSLVWSIARRLTGRGTTAHAELVLSLGGREMSDVSQRQDDQEAPRFYNVPEAARILRISPMTLYRAIEENAFPAIRVRNRLAVPAKAIDDMEAAALTKRSAVDAADWTHAAGR